MADLFMIRDKSYTKITNQPNKPKTSVTLSVTIWSSQNERVCPHPKNARIFFPQHNPDEHVKNPRQHHLILGEANSSQDVISLSAKFDNTAKSLVLSWPFCCKASIRKQLSFFYKISKVNPFCHCSQAKKATLSRIILSKEIPK